MQVNNKSLFFILGIIVVLLFVFGCTTEPKSSISGKITIYPNSSSSMSGKITIYADGNQSAKSTSQSSVSIKTVPDKKSEVHPVPEFVPDEIIVKYKPGVDSLNTAKSTSGSGYITASSIKNTGNGTMELLRLDLTDKALLSSDSVRDRTLKEIERLNSLPSVEFAEPNYIFKALFVPDDQYYVEKRLWALPLIKLDKVWASLTVLNDLSSVTVAVLDTGIARKSGPPVDHEDFLSGILSIFRDEYDFISDDGMSKDSASGRDPDATDPAAANTGFHGTHVAGTIGALTNNGVGVAGVAGGDSSAVNKGVWIMPLRVLGLGGAGSSWDIAQAIRYAAKLTNESGALPANRADIINMSFGGPANSQSIMLAVNAAYDAGVTLVAAAGNEGTSSPIYPAAYPNVISVAAVSVGSERAGYSNYGDTIDITAPGGDDNFNLDFDAYTDAIYSTFIDSDADDYIYLQGTSMAAPHVAGAAAIVVAGLKAIFAEVTPSEVKRILIDNAIDLGFPEFYGAGLLNVYAAACEALGQPQGAVLHPFPKTVRLEGSDTTGSFTLKNIGDGDSITINSVSEENDPDGIIPVSGISFTPGTVEINNGLDVQVSLNIDDVAHKDGASHIALIKITYDYLGTDYDEYVNVIYKYIDKVYVVARDPEPPNTILEMTVTSYEQGYEYTLEDLDPGSYIVGASTDLDEDDWIFTNNEVWGYYPDIGSRAIINLGSSTNLTNLDFLLIEGGL